jgi:hypothetical protein
MTTRTDRIQRRLDLRPATDPDDVLSCFVGPCALEDDQFPFEAISDVAEVESWRKEINRPIYHIHKWWAQRLGTVFNKWGQSKNTVVYFAGRPRLSGLTRLPVNSSTSLLKFSDPSTKPLVEA